MELSTLKKLRKIVPGTVFLFFSVPIYQFFVDDLFQVDDSLKFSLEGYGSVLAVIIGSLFGTLKIRRLRNEATHREINENIKSRLLEEGLTEERSEEEKNEIKNSRKLMHVFYHLIDNDESLKEKSKLVRDNGLIWTSTADVAILGCFFSWLYFILILIFGLDGLLASAGLMIGSIGLISGAILHPRTVKEHISLGNEQIEFILTNHKEELKRRVTELFN
ncbi:hypothetical protein [Sedimenticola thiotaurini]|uniref:Uncharacterized protein n=1 Tax=Sedimenticola thiotaurini TaxID=1543721 RepID=A0A0F7K2N7_9GAMM|nr:hypothetical protein [Sedimenticola thiotaurini]AKH21834.1 hypothetical protein AAY24_17465 [Sedimenticola thiotaurini]